MMKTQALLLTIVVSALALGCAPEEQLVFEEHCESRGLFACHINAPACNQRIAEFIACLREKPLLEMPRIEVISEAEWRAELTAKVQSQDGQNFEHFVTGLELFDRLPSTRPTPEQRIEREAGELVVERSADLIHLIDHGDGFASTTHYVELAMALTSSMLQREYDYEALAAMTEGDASYRSAVSGLFRGVEQLSAHFVALAIEERSFQGSSWYTLFDEIPLEAEYQLSVGETGLERHAAQNAPLPSHYGRWRVSSAWRRGQSAEVEELLASPPTSIDALSLGYDDIWSSETGEHRIIEANATLRNPLAGFELARDYVMGSFLTAYFIYRTLPEDENQRTPRTSWLADRFFVFHKASSGTTAALWLWAPGGDARDAEEWAERLRAHAVANEKPWLVQLHERDGQPVIALLACDDTDLLPPWQTQLERMMATVVLRDANASP